MKQDLGVRRLRNFCYVQPFSGVYVRNSFERNSEDVFSFNIVRSVKGNACLRHQLSIYTQCPGGEILFGFRYHCVLVLFRREVLKSARGDWGEKGMGQ